MQSEQNARLAVMMGATAAISSEDRVDFVNGGGGMGTATDASDACRAVRTI